MKALAITTFDGVDALEPVEIPDPTCGPKEVLMEVRTVGANRLDLAVLQGRGPGAGATLPLVPGIDPAGVVRQLGEEVDGLTVGDRIVAKPNIACFECHRCLAGEPWACQRQTIVGVHRAGGFGPLVALPATNAVAIPPGVSFAEASAAVHSFPVALRMLKQAGGVKPGQVVLVLGAAGAVGSATVQLCRMAGASIIAVVSGHAKAAHVAQLGARPIDRGRDEIAAAIGAEVPGGVDLIVDTAGDPESTLPALAHLGWRGTYVTCGSHGGGRIDIDLGVLYRERQRLVGSAASGYDDVQESFALLAANSVRAEVARLMPIGEAHAAFAALTSRSNIGKIVLEHP